MATAPQASRAVATPFALVLSIRPGTPAPRWPALISAGGGGVAHGDGLQAALVLLPHASVAVQRRETTLVPPQPLLTLSL